MNTEATDKEYLIFTNAAIYLDSERKAENIVVKDGKVEAIDIDISEYTDAEIIDLHGGVAYPGFIDSHVHPVEVGLLLSGADLMNCSNSDEIAKIISGLSLKLPDGTPLTGVGFSLTDYEAWSLDDLAKIDEVTGSMPFLAIDTLGHNMLVNSPAMEKCGITAKTPVPLGGKIIIQDGKPTGMLRESAMTLAGNVLFPLVDDNLIKNNIKKIFAKWSSMGYTSLVDLMGGPFGRIMKPELCRELERDGTLPIRVNYMYTFFGLDEIDNALEYIGKDTDMVRFGGLKLFVDGAYAAGQAWTTWTNVQGNNGLSGVYFDDTYGEKFNINRIIEKVNDLGLNIHYHMQGDKAIEVVLDALDAALKKKGKLTSVHTLIHLAFPTDEQVERMKGFGEHIVTTVQPVFWKVEGDLSRYYDGRDKRCYPAKKLFDTGVTTGISTDFSVSPLEYTAPTKIMSIAMSGADDPVNHPPLTMKDLILGFTAGSAAATPKKDTGMLGIGYNADIVVYDKDFYSVSPEELAKDNPKVISTWIGGRKVYENEK